MDAFITPADHVAALFELLAPGPDTTDVAAVEALLACIDRVGATRDQAVYARGYQTFFAGLDGFAERLAEQRFLGGTTPNRADLWLFALLVRHDVAWYPFYKLNRARLRDMPVLGAFARDLYQWPGVAKTIDFAPLRAQYATLDAGRNPKQVVPTGGVPDLWRPQQRHQLGGPSHARLTGSQESQIGRSATAWVRGVSAHRGWIEPGGRFPPEAGRYHLYIANNCPWCHRTALVRSLLGLEDVVSMDVLYYRRDPERGWQFRPSEPGCTPDTVHGRQYIKEVYAAAESSESSVPILYDKVTHTIVSNESADIIRMFNDALRPLGHGRIDLAPPALQDAIDAINVWTYHTINNGAYKAGFTASQQAHMTAADALFEAFFELDRRLATQPFLCGETVTEADLRLYPTIFRFDAVYYTRFLLNRRMVRDYPHLEAWRARFAALPGVAEASNMAHCKQGYFGRTGNALVPIGPLLP